MKIKNLILISIFLVIAILFVPNTVNAVGEKIIKDDFEYKVLSENTVATSKYKGNSANIVIPPKVTLDGVEYDVVSIGSYTFYDMEFIQSVEIPASITSIEQQAFYICTGIKSIEIPDSVTFIGDAAFSRCTTLKTVNMSKNVTTLDQYAFAFCYSLTDINLPDTLTTIGYNAFGSCESLKSIEIPKNVNSISSYAFSYCDRLKEIYFKGTQPPTTLEQNIFADSNEELTIYIPFEYYESYKNAFSNVNVSYCKVETKDNVDTYTIYHADGKNLVFEVTNGIDGVDGANGKDGITPNLRINSKGELEVSYDEGKTWNSLGKVVGEDGKNGADGKDGVDGKDGKDGADGKNGTNGKDGKDATSTTTPNGKDGEDGKDGKTPKLQINSKGELEVSYDEGKTWTSLGNVVGKDGADGKKEVIENEANIKYGIREYIVCALAVLGNIGWIVALKRRK